MADDWIKLYARLTSDKAIIEANAEHGTRDPGWLFIEGLCYCAGNAHDGVIPAGQIPRFGLPDSAALVDLLVRKRLWTKVKAGYRVRNFREIQDQLDALEQRRKADRERQQKRRLTSTKRPVSRDTNRDTSRDVTVAEQEKEQEVLAAANAAAASTPPPPHSADLDEHPAVAILRQRLAAVGMTASWATMSDPQLAAVDQLIHTHGGDQPLVDAARRMHRPNDPAVYATAWLATWAQMPTPGQRLRVVPPQHRFCDQPGHEYETLPCTACTVARKIGATT